MKIICTQENLKNGLSVVVRIISPNNTLPILNNLLLQTENGMLKISSTNLEVAITTQVRCKIEEEGQVTVLAKTLMELVNNLPNTNLNLETVNGDIKIESEQYHTALKTLPAEDFPLIPNIEKNQQIKLPAQDFKQALDQVAFAASTNQTQAEIAGVLLSVGKQLKLAATDRYRLAEKKLELKSNPQFELEVILPQKTTAEISRIIGTTTEDLEITFNQNQAGFIIGQTQVVSRLVDGQYPDYAQIIPSEFKANVKVERKALISALRAGGIFSQGSNSVAFGLDNEASALALSSESSDLGKSNVQMPAEINGRAENLMLNFHYVLDCLNAIPSEKVVLKFIDDSSPALVVPEDDVSYLYLVMPIKN